MIERWVPDEQEWRAEFQPTLRLTCGCGLYYQRGSEKTEWLECPLHAAAEEMHALLVEASTGEPLYGAWLFLWQQKARALLARLEAKP